MAIQKFTLRVCDTCSKPDDVRRCRIDIEGRRGTHADLCAACRKPLERTIERINEHRVPVTRVSELPVVSEADIARMGQPVKPRRKRALAVVPPEGTTTA